MSRDPSAVLDDAGKAGTGDLDIARVALALSAIAAPGIDLRPAEAHLDAITAEILRRAAGSVTSPRAVVGAITATLQGTFGYDGDRTSYDDLRNADLAAVIERRKGLPVALGILVIHAARALGASAHGINFPGHFLVGVATAGGSILCDPFNATRIVDADDLDAMLPRGTALDGTHVAALSDRGTLIRLQNNIVTRARGTGDWAKAATTLETLVRLAPDAVQYRYDWGIALANAERPIAARAALAEALKRAPGAPWAGDAAAWLARLARSLN